MSRGILALIFGLFLTAPTLASVPEIPELLNRKQQYVTDDQLKELAMKNGVIPADAGEAYLRKEIAEKNTVTMWILLPRGKKVAIIEQVIKLFGQNDGAIISRPAAYYVNEINSLIYSCVIAGDVGPGRARGVGVMLKTIAVMDGDYDDGTDKLELARNHLGREYFEIFKRRFPDKYQYLLGQK